MVYPCLVDMSVEFGFEWIPTSGEHNCHKGLFVYCFMLVPPEYIYLSYMSLLSQVNQSIHGLVPGILYGQNERVDELNSRILDRVRPDSILAPNFDVRPVPTKYARFPVIDRLTMPKVGIRQEADYSVDRFAPIQSRGPVSGFMTHVDDESGLRNQFFAIQSAPQAAFIPDSKSDLYEVSMAPNVSRQEQQPYSGLFDQYQMNVLAPTRNADPKIGSQMFRNNTRVQLRSGTLNPMA